MTTARFSMTSALLIGMSLSTVQGSPKKIQASLKEVEETAHNAAEEADPLRFGIKLSQETHYNHLMVLKDDVNSMNRMIKRLDAESASLDPWEKQAVTKVEPLLRETALDVQNAINSFERNKHVLWRDDYRGYINGVVQGSDQIAKTLKDYLRYARARALEEEFGVRLGVSGQ